MANEITTTASILYTPSETFRVELPFKGIKIDQTGTDYSGASETVTTSEGNLGKGSITTIGLVIIKNLDATNYIELGTTTGQLPVKVKAGESALFRVDATNVIAKANTASCIVQYLLIED